MRYLLDTNICIFMIKEKNPLLMEHVSKNHVYGLGISSITLAELEYGVCASVNRERNAAALLGFLVGVTVLGLGASVAAEYGAIRADLRRKGTPIGALDMLIAAHAKTEELILVTNNVREFRRVVGLAIEDWTL